MKVKKFIIFQEFSHKESILFNKNLRKVNFSVLSSKDKEYIQNCLENKKIKPYSSKLIQAEIHSKFSQVYFIRLKPIKNKISKLCLSGAENYNYNFINKKKKYCKTFIKKSFVFLYNLAKISVLLLIAILTYLLIAFSKIKWPNFDNKDKDDKSKCDDDPNAPGCCSCEEIKEKSESMGDRIKQSIQNAEAQASKGRMKNMVHVGAIGNMLGVPFIENDRIKQEEETFETIEKNVDKLENKMNLLERNNFFLCDCDEILSLIHI